MLPCKGSIALFSIKIIIIRGLATYIYLEKGKKYVVLLAEKGFLHEFTK